MKRMLEATARAEDTHFWFLGLRRTAQQLIDHALAGRPIARIIDCGAGTGRNLDWLSHYGSATGVELSPVGLEAGRRRGRRLVQGTVSALPFADGSADLVTSFDVLYCLDDETEAAALREMHRVVKPDGLVVVNVAALDILRGSHSTLTGEIRRYTPSRLKQRLNGAGFRIERMTFTNMTPFPFALAVRGFETVTGRTEGPSNATLRVPPGPINAGLNAALAAEAGLLRFMNLPIGTSLIAVARPLP